jgi:hypothetical protein
MKFGMSENIGYVGFRDPKYYRSHSENTQRVLLNLFYLIRKLILK